MEQTAMASHLMRCHSCELLNNALQKNNAHHHHCSRCGSILHYRKPNSLVRTFALLLTAAICYIPANLLPIMQTTTLGKTQSDTIISGVIYLIVTNNWPLALVVFFASIVVPLLKMLILSILLYTVYRGSSWRPRERVKLFRIVEAVGRWSMVDIFVVTILVALVQMSAIAQVEADSGAIFFGAVVVLTMFSAMAFDPRLIWDRIGGKHD